MTDKKDDVALARDGNKEAYHRLVDTHKDRVFALVLSMVGHQREQAEDLLQEIFVKAYFALQNFEGQSSFYTWIYRIASNHCLDYLRKNKLKQVSMDAVLSEDSEMTLGQTLPAPLSEDPEIPMASRDESAALLGSLDPDQRLILSLRELEGYSYEELANLLKCPINTVKSRLNRAREALKAAYEKMYGNKSLDNIVLESREKS